jgi:hypothetical protein
MDRRGELLLAVAAAALRDPLVASFKDQFRDTMTRDPLDSVLMTALVGSYLFFNAEKGENPKVNTFADALVFVTTSLSVGYSDIFPRTEKGKLIASALQTFGPALTARVLDPVASGDGSKAAEVELAKAELIKAELAKAELARDDESISNQRAMLLKLDAILEELRAHRLSSSAG